MNLTSRKLTRFVALSMVCGTIQQQTCLAGKSIPWENLPAAVQTTILAHGGIAGQTVDEESAADKVNGLTLYEAGVKDEKGNRVDLEVTSDGKLIEIKTDDAADAAAEKVAAPRRKGGRFKFSHPREINHPYLPLATLKQDIIEGTEAGQKTRVARTVLPDRHKTFQIAGQSVDALVVEDRAWVDGVLSEVAIDYFAQDDEGNVYYFGEDVDEYEDGKVANHDGSWLLGKDTQTPGVILPAHPKVGDRFKSESVSKEISELDVVISLSETVTVPAGIFKNCIKIEEHAAGEGVEYKYYAPGVGVVREMPDKGDELLTSHTTVSK